MKGSQIKGDVSTPRAEALCRATIVWASPVFPLSPVLLVEPSQRAVESLSPVLLELAWRVVPLVLLELVDWAWRVVPPVLLELA